MRRIGPTTPRRIYIREWREHRELTQQQLADRLDTDKGTISRYERGHRRLDGVVLQDLAYALDVDVPDLYRHPAQPSADALLRDASPQLVSNVISIIEALKRAAS
jgi:transcriptional regulator with XRE-family HTH domain